MTNEIPDGYIDCEPTWAAILEMALDSPNPSAFKKSLLSLAQMGDILRQAQKAGVKIMYVTFETPHSAMKISDKLEVQQNAI